MMCKLVNCRLDDVGSLATQIEDPDLARQQAVVAMFGVALGGMYRDSKGLDHPLLFRERFFRDFLQRFPNLVVVECQHDFVP